MHLIYRTKKQTLPVVRDNKLAPYMTPVSHHQSPPTLVHKKSIEIILDKHITPVPQNTQTLLCYKPQRKTQYKFNRTKRAQSGLFHVAGRSQHIQPKSHISRNKSTQIVQRNESLRKRGQLQYSPYVLGQRKSGSVQKLKVQVEETEEKDWICANLIEKQVYAIDEGSDFC